MSPLKSIVVKCQCITIFHIVDKILFVTFTISVVFPYGFELICFPAFVFIKLGGPLNKTALSE